jgi:hypothetical protein
MHTASRLVRPSTLILSIPSSPREIHPILGRYEVRIREKKLELIKQEDEWIKKSV